MADGLFENHMARLNITWGGSNGDLTDLVGIDPADIKHPGGGSAMVVEGTSYDGIIAIATECVQHGMPGIDADNTANFKGFMADYYPATGDLPNRVILRPSTPFGDNADF